MKKIYKKYLFFFIIIIIISIFSILIKEKFQNQNCSTIPIPCSDKVYDIIIVIGQSNATGSFVSDNDMPSRYNNIYHDDIHYVINPRVDKVNLNTDSPNTIQICRSVETKNNYSMVTSFGREYANNNPTKNVLIINVAKRSTGLLKRYAGNSDYVWQLTDSSAGKALYPIAKNFIRNVKSKICNTSRVVAICYEGSEEDSYKEHKSGHDCGYERYDQPYKDIFNYHLTNLLNTLKNDVGDRDTKILVCGILLGTADKPSGHPCSQYFSDNVLKYVANRNNYIFVTTDSVSKLNSIEYFKRRLDSANRGVHYNKLSHIELGKRCYYAYANPNYLN